MGDYKFDNFYYSVDDSDEHYLSEIEDLSDEEYNSHYKGKMYCPVCKGPQLALVKKEDSLFLRTYPKQPHIPINGEMCPYECDTASKTDMEEYVKELRDKKKIKSVLEATMRKLFRQNSTKSFSSTDSGNHTSNPLIIQKEQSDKVSTKRIIPHYSFNSWGKNIPQEQLLIVYGKVYIELKQIQTVSKDGIEITQTYIHFKYIHSKKLITSCIKPQALDVKEGYYYAVVLGMCRLKEVKGYTYHNLWINSPVEESILLKPFSL